MEQGRHKQWIAGVLLIAFASIWLISCPADKEAATDQPADLSSGQISEQHAEPFSTDEVAPIAGNEMHELHFAGGSVCGECHLSTEPMPINHAHEVCAQCHPEQTVAKEVWQNHCLSCHHFTKGAQAAAGDPDKLLKNLCSECHNPEDRGGHIYASCAYKAPNAATHVVCSRCHRPHETAEPVDAKICHECHPELTGVTHLVAEKTDCSLCHRSHHEQVPSQDLCTACHGQATGVMVHRIKQHSTDCLSCHDAHFVNVGMSGSCRDCHEDMNYNGSAYQPVAHLDCQGCHSKAPRVFDGNWKCANCHATQSSQAKQMDAATHRNCTGCHPPHQWSAPRSKRCTSCHEPGPAFEHRFSKHPRECTACHGVHNPGNVPESGDCLACHGGDPQFPRFKPGANQGHLVCSNCHNTGDEDEYRYVGPQDSCLLCHSRALDSLGLAWEDVPEGHRYCVGCHQAHTWDQVPITGSCFLCHKQDDLASGNQAHQGCFNCHAMDHGFGFTGAGQSCLLCHGQLPDSHGNEAFTDCIACHNIHGSS